MGPGWHGSLSPQGCRQPTVIGFSSSFRGSLVTRWEAPGGIGSSSWWVASGQLFSFSTLMLLVGSLTCKTVSRMTYTVLVETLNPIPTHSLLSGRAQVLLLIVSPSQCRGSEWSSLLTNPDDYIVLLIKSLKHKNDYFSKYL